MASGFIVSPADGSHTNMRFGDPETNCYTPQSEWYYCAPASVLMVLKYINYPSLPTQDDLAHEMNCTSFNMGVTKVSDFLTPFDRRGIYDYAANSLALQFTDALKVLKSDLKKDYAAILNIWFDDDKSNGHLVVVFGYNETGVFIHDPWNNTSNPPKNRDFGPFMFLPNEKLKSLWSDFNYWAFILKRKLSFSLRIRLKDHFGGLPDVNITIFFENGTVCTSMKTGSDGSISTNLPMAYYKIQVFHEYQSKIQKIEMNSDHSLNITITSLREKATFIVFFLGMTLVIAIKLRRRESLRRPVQFAFILTVPTALGLFFSKMRARGLVETRIFPGEQGRGGRFTKMRVAYKKETIKRYIDEQIMKIKQK